VKPASEPDTAREVEYIIKPPMLINRPVRSGQQIYARDTDLIIIGQVGPGAETIPEELRGKPAKIALDNERLSIESL